MPVDFLRHTLITLDGMSGCQSMPRKLGWHLVNFWATEMCHNNLERRLNFLFKTDWNISVAQKLCSREPIFWGVLDLQRVAKPREAQLILPGIAHKRSRKVSLQNKILSYLEPKSGYFLCCSCHSLWLEKSGMLVHQNLPSHWKIGHHMLEPKAVVLKRVYS